MQKVKTAPALVLILLGSMLVLANGYSQSVSADWQCPALTPILTAAGEPLPVGQDDTTNPAPPWQIGQHEYALPQGAAVISPNINAFRSTGNHRNTHLLHQNETNTKLEKATCDLSIPKTVFKQINRQYCQYLDIPPPYA